MKIRSARGDTTLVTGIGYPRGSRAENKIERKIGMRKYLRATTDTEHDLPDSVLDVRP
jgi:hypothetical protein